MYFLIHLTHDFTLFLRKWDGGKCDEENGLERWLNKLKGACPKEGRESR